MVVAATRRRMEDVSRFFGSGSDFGMKIDAVPDGQNISDYTILNVVVWFCSTCNFAQTLRPEVNFVTLCAMGF